MGTLEGKRAEPRVTIRFLAPFQGRDNWNLEIAIAPGESLTSCFSAGEGAVPGTKRKNIRFPSSALRSDFERGEDCQRSI